MKKNLLLIGLMTLGMLVGCGGTPSSEAPAASNAPASNPASTPSAAHVHTWNAGEITKAATCTTNGTRTYKCTVDGCGQTKTETIIAKGHTWDEGKVTTEPGCGTAGEKTFTCTGCKETKTEEIAAQDHVWEDKTAGEDFTVMTCKNDGITYLARPSLKEGKWDKGTDYSYAFKVGKATAGKLLIGAQMSSSSHTDRTLFTNSSGASDSDTFESNSANDGTCRLKVTVNGTEVEVTQKKTYGELMNAESISYFELASVNLVNGDNTIVITTHGETGYRLVLGGEVRVLVDEYVKA